MIENGTTAPFGAVLPYERQAALTELRDWPTSVLRRLLSPDSDCAASVGRAAQFRSAFRLRRSGSRFGFDRLDPGALDLWSFDADPRCIGRTGLLRRVQRTRPGHRSRHQHLRDALVAEVAIGEAHARDRTTEVALVLLVEIEAGLERKALDRRADGLTADLKRIAGKAHLAHRSRTAELYRACSTTVLEHTPGTAGTVEAGKRKHLAGDKLASFFAIHHLPGQGRHDQRTGRKGTQHQTRKHAVTPTY